jgi:HD-GYP domain-containing protein (c-di-GMP phosphodiesterase class II)
LPARPKRAQTLQDTRKKTFKTTATISRTALSPLEVIQAISQSQASPFKKEIYMLASIHSIPAFGIELEERGLEPSGHTTRLVRLVESMAAAFGLDDTGIEALSQAAYLHDIGKLVLPAGILFKSGRLDPGEWAVIKTHSHWSHTLAKTIPGIHEAALGAILHHHERWDGTGYPNALQGRDIPLEARILTVCDVYDTLLSQRPYSRAWGIDSTLEELQKNSGTQFDPAVIEAFLDKALGKLTLAA